MTRRRYLTKRERADMAFNQGFRCGCGCDQPLGEKTIGEHWIQVAFGNENKPDTLLRYDCAKAKDKRDAHARAKVRHAQGISGQQARRERRKAEGKGALIQGRGFDKSKSKRFSGEVVERRS